MPQPVQPPCVPKPRSGRGYDVTGAGAAPLRSQRTKIGG